MAEGGIRHIRAPCEERGRKMEMACDEGAGREARIIPQGRIQASSIRDGCHEGTASGSAQGTGQIHHIRPHTPHLALLLRLCEVRDVLQGERGTCGGVPTGYHERIREQREAHKGLRKPQRADLEQGDVQPQERSGVRSCRNGCQHQRTCT